MMKEMLAILALLLVSVIIRISKNKTGGVFGV